MSRGTLRTAVSSLAIAGAAAAVWGIGIERHLYTLRQHTLAVLPAGSDPIRVLHISDVHMAPWQQRKQAWIASLAALRPDFIVNTGDNMGHEDGLRGVRAAYAGFRGVPGVFVHGSNDTAAPAPRNPFKYFFGPSKGSAKETTPFDVPAMESFFTDTLGWQSVDNGAASFTVRGHTVDVFGVGDGHRDWDRLDLLPSFAESLRREATDLPRVKFGVTHAPYQRILNAFAEEGADVLFAGHTHGGQIRVPGFGALVANCDLPLRQTRGLSSWQADGRTVPLNVSAGLGHSIYAPIRFACRPEASLLTLVPHTS